MNKILILFGKSCKQGRADARINIYPNKPLSTLVPMCPTSGKMSEYRIPYYFKWLNICIIEKIYFIIIEYIWSYFIIEKGSFNYRHKMVIFSLGI